MDRVTAVPFRFATGDWDVHLLRLEKLDFRVAVVGPQGSGKTTLLEQLDRRIPARFALPTHYVRVPNEVAGHAVACAEVSEHADDKMILLDSAEKLSWIRWRGVLKRCLRHGLVVAVHQPCGLPTWIRATTSASLLISLIREFGYEPCQISDARARQIYHTHQGNIRDALRYLYDQVACGELRLPAQSD